MNPSTALATVLIDEWVRCGVREVVLCPGSRSAPLAYAVQQAEREGRLRLHVRVDERSAGFLALGLAKVSRRPAVVLTTSGTAVANLHPAVLEAHHGYVPLVVLTADRPGELRGTGANQTTVQPGLFAGAVRWEHDLPAPDRAGGASGRAAELLAQGAAWRSAVCRGWAAASGWQGDPGPVHLNVAFRDPLAPDLRGQGGPGSTSSTPAGGRGASVDDVPQLQGRPGARPWVELAGLHRRLRAAPGAGAAHEGEVVRAGAPGAGAVRSARETTLSLLVLGDLPDPADAQKVLDVAAHRGWPVIAEPFGTSDRRGVLPHGPLLLSDRELLARHLPRRVVTVGRLTLSREVSALLGHPEIEVEHVSAVARWTDPSHVVSRVHRLDDWLTTTGAVGDVDDSTQENSSDAGDDVVAAWRVAGARLADRLAVAQALGSDSAPTGQGVAVAVERSLAEGDTLVLGSSNPPRDLDLAGDGASRGRRTVVGNRGLAGIDGMVSTAIGAALAAPAGSRTVALLGDLTFLHDSNGLLIGPDEPRPDLTIVVVNDDGGGIFATLEHGAPERADDFERVFGTPTRAGLAQICAGHGVPHQQVGSLPALFDALAQDEPGIRVLEVPVERGRHRELRDRLRRTAAGDP
ncbi:MAG: 2-succinyl-5-enolpyruvyl-6-hydroxy-3-cyclohexene-1-carboxylic-acid synthase [Actinobacteria bacterium]|nr:2-succinyl-5-enolpyruvyl-6-hydroxy-3-cyclohexene-1-carboxylic-acid synthase [Actinomycetota bacterium]